MLEVLNEGFKKFLAKGDPRVKDWPMMQTPFPGFAMIVAYIYFVKVAGPQFMKKREPFQLRTPMVLYNFLLVILNLIFFIGFGWAGWFADFSWKCQPVDYSNAPKAVMMAKLGYLFYLTKFVEFADTIFFVLRKKYNQISTLHVVHHSIVPFSLWMGIKFTPGGHHSLFPFMNSLVHVIMYTYYGLAAMGEKYKKYLFWKKSLTYIQLVQFVIIIVHSTSLYINNCDSSIVFTSMNLMHALLFFGLFANFFIQTYTKKAKTTSQLASSEKSQPLNYNDQTSIGNEKVLLAKKFTNGHVKHRSIHSMKDVLEQDIDICNNSLKNNPTTGTDMKFANINENSDENCKRD